MKDKKIAIIGDFGGKEKNYGGQTIKTRILYDELKKATKWKIKSVDTFYKRSRPIGLLIKSIATLLSTRDIVVLLAQNGIQFYFPILYFFVRVFKTRVYYDVIGGWLGIYVKNNPEFKKYLNAFQVNWIETARLKEQLEVLGVENCEVMPNFKRLNITEVTERNYSEPFRFCYFARVAKEKGVETAINVIEVINKEAGKIVCVLDIYGPIFSEAYQQAFEKMMQEVTSAIQYKGAVAYDQSVETIKDYDALLFPTLCVGEGFPGTIIDAFSAGLPVIAISNEWNCNGEIVKDRVNGILYPNAEIPDLKSAIEWLMTNKDQINNMKKACIEAAKNYQPDQYIKRIINRISG